MDEKHPSLPANYVSLVQLQERWLKEKERKQREEEEEEKRKLIEKERRGNRKRNENGVGWRTGAYRSLSGRNRHHQSEKDDRPTDVRELKSVEAKIDDVVVRDGENNDESVKNMKKKKWKDYNKRKLRFAEKQTGGILPVSCQSEEKKEIPVVVSDTENLAGGIVPVSCESEGKKWMSGTSTKREEIGRHSRRNDRNQIMDGRVLELKVLVDETEDVRRKFEHLSTNRLEKGSVRSTAGMKGGNWKYNTGFDYGISDRRKPRERGYANLVWVRKDEVSGSKVVDIPNSGSLLWNRECTRRKNLHRGSKRKAIVESK